MAKKGKIYLATFRRQLAKSVTQKQMRDNLLIEAKKFFRLKKREYLREFNSHNVTRELERGAFARGNISGTLPGLAYEAGAGGNLFSFIGFRSSAKPIDSLRAALEKGTILRRTPHSVRKVKVQGGFKWRFVFKIKYPTINDLVNLTPMPWEPGSWLKKIENGISGLGFYIWQRKGFGGSRSGSAVQSVNAVRTAEYQPVEYLTYINRKVFAGWKA